MGASGTAGEQVICHQPAAVVCTGPSPIHGTGCFARVALQPGDPIGTFTGPVVQEDGEHVLWACVDGRWEGRDGTGPLRFLNHSDTPNAQFDGFVLYAVSGIAVGQEITIDYQPELTSG